MNSLTVAIAVPLEAEFVAHIRGEFPDVTVLFEPELLPPERYPADHAGDPNFTRTSEQEARYWAMISAADILYGIPGDSVEGLRSAAENSRLQWIQATAAGAGGTVRHADLSAETLERLRISTSAGVHAVPLAEFALLGILNGLKNVPELTANQNAKHWPSLRTPVPLVSGSSLVITGLGEIGLEIARLASALGMKVSGTKRTLETLEHVGQVSDMAGLPALLRDADVLVNTLPGTPYTDKVLNSEVFSAMKPGGVFINVGRGSVVDEEALIDALDSGQLGYACLDVFAVEPLPLTSPLWEHPQVLISPHSAALSTGENRLIMERFCENLARFRSGRPLKHVVDSVHFY